MPFKYKPKASAKKRNPFTKQQMAIAIADVEKGMSLRESADRITLSRYVQNKEKLTTFNETGSQYKANQVSTFEEKKVFVDYLLECRSIVSAMKLASAYAIAKPQKCTRKLDQK